MSEIDPTGTLSPYRQVAGIIADKITSGEYPRGSRIPTESELVETYEIARSTARRALAKAGGRPGSGSSGRKSIGPTFGHLPSASVTRTERPAPAPAQANAGGRSRSR